MRRVADNAIQAANFYSVGKQMANGVAQGIESGGGIVSRASRNLINTALTAMRSEADINSPSGATMLIADFLALGIVKGTENRLKPRPLVPGRLKEPLFARQKVLKDIQKTATKLSQTFTDNLSKGMKDGLEYAELSVSDRYRQMFDSLQSIAEEAGSAKVKTELMNFQALLNEVDGYHGERKGKEKHHNTERLRNLMHFNHDIVQALEGHHNELVRLVERANQDEEIVIEDSLQRQIRARLDVIERHIQAVQDSTRQIVAEYEKQHRALLDSLDYSENETLRALQGRLDAIDAQTKLLPLAKARLCLAPAQGAGVLEAENRALREQQEARRLADLQAAIDSAETDEDRLRATERFNEEMGRQQREALLRSRREEQAALREQMQEVRQNYSQRRDEAQRHHDSQVEQARETERNQLEFLNSLQQMEQENFSSRQRELDGFLREYNNAIDRSHNEQSQSQERQNREIQSSIEAHQNNLLETLNRYIPKWGDAGDSSSAAFLSSIQNAMPQIENAGRDMALGVAQGIQSNGGIVANAAQLMIEQALAAMRKNFLPCKKRLFEPPQHKGLGFSAAAISSPSRKTRTIGQQLMDGLTGGLESKMSELAEACKRITDSITDSITGSIEDGLYIELLPLAKARLCLAPAQGAGVLDSSQLIDSAKAALNSIKAALPTLESNIYQATAGAMGGMGVAGSGPISAAHPVSSGHTFTINMGGTYHVREDADIEKIAYAAANEVMRKLKDEIDYSGRFRR